MKSSLEMFIKNSGLLTLNDIHDPFHDIHDQLMRFIVWNLNLGQRFKISYTFLRSCGPLRPTCSINRNLPSSLAVFVPTILPLKLHCIALCGNQSGGVTTNFTALIWPPEQSWIWTILSTNVKKIIPLLHYLVRFIDLRIHGDRKWPPSHHPF